MPRAIGNLISFLLNFSLDIISLKKTFSLLEFGISIPIVLLPGIVATLVETELVFLAMSSAKLTILDTFIPDAGSNSYKVTTGPQLIFLILPSTLKSNRIFSRNSEFLDSSALSIFFLFFKSRFFCKKFIAGSLKKLTLLFTSLFFEKGKIGCFSFLESCS